MTDECEVANVGVRAGGGRHHVLPRDRHGVCDIGVLVDAGAGEMEVVSKLSSWISKSYVPGAMVVTRSPFACRRSIVEFSRTVDQDRLADGTPGARQEGRLRGDRGRRSSRTGLRKAFWSGLEVREERPTARLTSGRDGSRNRPRDCCVRIRRRLANQAAWRRSTSARGTRAPPCARNCG